MLDTMTTKVKSFSWSYSKLKNFETCPLRYKAVDVDRSVEQTRSEALDDGDELHEAMKSRVVGSTPLPPHLIYMERWAEKLTRMLHPLQIIQCELKLSTDRQGKPTGYFDRTTWLRTKIDYLRFLPTEEKNQDFAHVVDYKTGRPPKVWDGTQLLINAYLIFQHYQSIAKMRVDYLWTKYNDTTHEMFARADTPKAFDALLPRVNALEEAHVTGNFPPKPCGLCEDYCPVATCQHHGKRMGR
jgi:PD-(D/E)XK nuclease superfamily